MIDLKFTVETAENGARVKVREDGRRGACRADEAPLWDALQEALAELEKLKGEHAEHAAQAEHAQHTGFLGRKTDTKRK